MQYRQRIYVSLLTLIIFFIFSVVIQAESTVLPLTGIYKFDLISSTDSQILDIARGTSINDSGTVAYVARVNSGQGIFTRNFPNQNLHINPNYTSSSRIYEPAVQIDNKNWIIARDRLAGAPVCSVSDQLGHGDRLE